MPSLTFVVSLWIYLFSITSYPALVNNSDSFSTWHIHDETVQRMIGFYLQKSSMLSYRLVVHKSFH